jgi:hypothetical protein
MLEYINKFGSILVEKSKTNTLVSAEASSMVKLNLSLLRAESSYIISDDFVRTEVLRFIKSSKTGFKVFYYSTNNIGEISVSTQYFQDKTIDLNNFEFKCRDNFTYVAVMAFFYDRHSELLTIISTLFDAANNNINSSITSSVTISIADKVPVDIKLLRRNPIIDSEKFISQLNTVRKILL